jgi:hypothetical protein
MPGEFADDFAISRQPQQLRVVTAKIIGAGWSFVPVDTQPGQLTKRTLVVSASSIRSLRVPPRILTISQVSRKLTPLPKCRKPLGVGAMRPLISWVRCMEVVLGS